MPREVQINTTVNSSKAVSNINTLKKAFQELNKQLDKHGKDGALKIKIDLEGVDIKLFKELSTGFSKLGKGMEQFNKNIDDISKSGKLLSITTNNINNNVQKTSNTFKTYNKTLRDVSKTQKVVGDELLSTLASWTLAQRVISQTIGAYSQLTDATYGVGIAGRMNLAQIGELNKSFIELSTTVPQSAQGLAQAVDGLIRTGRSYDDARKIIKEVANLSVASGDDLKSTAELVTKVMVSLGVSGDYAEETLNTLHSVAIQTASDMSYLAGAFKSVAGASSVLVASSGYAGKELDEYKQKVLSTNMAMIGALANTGLSASY